MANVLKISEAASLALHAMAYLMANQDRLVPTREVSTALNVSVNHLSKVLQRLVRAGFILTVRGPKGGARLAKAGDSISLLDIYETIEGPLTPTDCLLSAPVCNGGSCILGGLLKNVNWEVTEYLRKTSLSELEHCIPHQKEVNHGAEEEHHPD